MKPVHQRIKHDPKNGKEGDCLRACIASLLELPIGKVPHFIKEETRRKKNCYDLVQQFLKKFGYYYIIVDANSTFAKWQAEHAGYHIITGKTSSGSEHAVVGLAGKMVFDPEPSKCGLEKILYYEYIVCRRVAATQPSFDYA